MTFNTYPHNQNAAVIAFFLSLLLLFLCACESGNGNYQKNLTVNCISNRTDTGFSSRYDLFSGERAYTIKVAEGEMLPASLDKRPPVAVVSVLPENPDPNTLYLIPEEAGT